MKRKYRFPEVQRERISVEYPVTGFPKLSRSATTGRAFFQKDESGFVSRAASAGACTLTMVPLDARSAAAASAPSKLVRMQLCIECSSIQTSFGRRWCRGARHKYEKHVVYVAG